MALTVVLGGLALSPAAAAADDRYVDAETGANSSATCPLPTPCATIAYAVANSGAGDRILIDSGSYAESVTLTDGRSLEFQDFVPADGTVQATIDGGAGTAVTVAPSGAGHIRGLRIWGDANGVALNGPAEVDSNSFNDPDASAAVGVLVNTSTPGSTIHDNSFADPAPSGTRSRLGVFAVTPASVVENSFSGFNLAIQVSTVASDPTLVAENQITGTHFAPFVGRAILVHGSSAVTIRENRITASGASVIGIEVTGAVALVRNEITDQATGVLVANDSTGTTLEGDRVWGNSVAGLHLTDTGSGGPTTSATATNVTVVGSGNAILLNNAALTMDSSIVDSSAAGATSTCTITHSNGPPDAGDTTGCHNFISNADPMLVDPTNGDLHLLPGSSLLDLGNPASPGATTDFDGDPRALDATPGCSGNVNRRDIGADEFVPPPPPDCDPPQTTLTKTPPKKTRRARVTFKFEADEASTFQCRLDSRPFRACVSPYRPRVKRGKHVFQVVATDTPLNADPTPAKFRFRRIKR